MKAGLTADTFTRLLHRLDADRERAGEKYEDLRRTLIRFFEWRGAPYPEEHERCCHSIKEPRRGSDRVGAISFKS
jgi:hypothetical protein